MEELKALELDPDTREEQITSMVQHIKGLKYCFRSWDPRCTLKWMERYSWVALNIPYIITHKMAMHRSAFILAKSLVGNGLKPPRIHRIFAELYDLTTDYTLATAMSHQYHASSHQSASASSDNQTDLRQYFMGGSHNQGITERGSLQESWTNGNTKPELVSRKAISSLPPSECFLRTLIKEEFGAKEEYEHLWREQHIPCKRLSADFARKAFKAQNVGGTKILNSSLRVYNEYGQIKVGISCDSESFSQGAAHLAISTLGEVLLEQDSKVERIKVDKPHQDGPGIIAALGKCIQAPKTIDVTSDAMIEVHHVHNTIAVDTAVTNIRECIRTNGCGGIGFDLEWFNPQQKGMKAKPVALMIVAPAADRCCLFRMRVDGKSHPVPASLRRLLEDSTVTKAGVHIKGDITYLKKDHDGIGCAYRGEVKGAKDISTLATELQVLPRRPRNALYSMVALARQVLHINMDKSPDQVSNWECKELSESQRKYAAMDGIMSFLVFQQLKKKATNRADEQSLPLVPGLLRNSQALSSATVNQAIILSDEQKQRSAANKERVLQILAAKNRQPR
jgi:hypothetical protein